MSETRNETEMEGVRAVEKIKSDLNSLARRVQATETQTAENQKSLHAIDMSISGMSIELKGLHASIDNMINRVDQQTGKSERDLKEFSEVVVEALHDISESFQESNKMITQNVIARLAPFEETQKELKEKDKTLEDRIATIEKRTLIWLGGISATLFLITLFGDEIAAKLF